MANSALINRYQRKLRAEWARYTYENDPLINRIVRSLLWEARLNDFDQRLTGLIEIGFIYNTALSLVLTNEMFIEACFSDNELVSLHRLPSDSVYPNSDGNYHQLDAQSREVIAEIPNNLIYYANYEDRGYDSMDEVIRISRVISTSNDEVKRLILSRSELIRTRIDGLVRWAERISK